MSRSAAWRAFVSAEHDRDVQLHNLQGKHPLRVHSFPRDFYFHPAGQGRTTLFRNKTDGPGSRAAREHACPDPTDPGIAVDLRRAGGGLDNPTPAGPIHVHCRVHGPAASMGRLCADRVRIVNANLRQDQDHGPERRHRRAANLEGVFIHISSLSGLHPAHFPIRGGSRRIHPSAIPDRTATGRVAADQCLRLSLPGGDSADFLSASHTQV